MSPEQICSRIARDLDYLAVEFLHYGQRGAALRAMEMSSSLLGESLFGDDSSPMQAAQQLTATTEGGAV